MKLPLLSEVQSSRSFCNAFGGYNHNLQISDGEWWDMANLSTQRYPVSCVRRKRTQIGTLTAAQGLIAKDALAWVDDNVLYYNANGGVASLQLKNLNCERQLVSMGAYIIIFPDKMWFNTASQTFESGDIEATYTNVGQVTFTLCTYVGDDFENYVTSITPPSSPNNGDYWMDISGDVNVLKIYASSTQTWNAVPTTYIRINATGIASNLNAMDGVEISFASGTETEPMVNNGISGSHIIQQKLDDNNIVIIGSLMSNLTLSTADMMTVSRTVPDMDFVCESNNRLWGCKFGKVGTQTVNILYASKLGDFKNWTYYAGTAADSYYMNLGSDGFFTGAINYRGMPTFFKENCIHIVYGDKPSNYQLKTIDARGVQKGSHKSLVIVDEVLYYMSRIDVCMFTGAPPTGISEAFGMDRFENGVAGRRGSLYYISMKNVETNTYYFMVYDTKKGMWCRETEWETSPNVGIQDFCYIDSDMVYIDNMGNLISTTGQYATQMHLDGDANKKEEEGVFWMAESGNIGFRYVDQKYVSRMVFRFYLAKDAHLDMFVQYDSDGIWKHAGSVEGYGLRSTVFPIIPKRCDHMKYKLVGNGDFVLYSTSYILEQGSDYT